MMTLAAPRGVQQNAVHNTWLENHMTSTAARFDLKLDQEGKDIFAQAAALMGTTMAGFVRAAAKEKALELLDRESRVTLSPRDFKAFVESLDAAFKPNPALDGALKLARRDVRRV
jgi:uncharacterized protein (DUF1778 family)